jgi:hypothetical protein
MKFSVVFWDILPCKIIVDRRFRGASTIILHGSISQKTSLNFIHTLSGIQTHGLSIKKIKVYASDRAATGTHVCISW